MPMFEVRTDVTIQHTCQVEARDEDHALEVAGEEYGGVPIMQDGWDVEGAEPDWSGSDVMELED